MELILDSLFSRYSQLRKVLLKAGIARYVSNSTSTAVYTMFEIIKGQDSKYGLSRYRTVVLIAKAAAKTTIAIFHFGGVTKDGMPGTVNQVSNPDAVS